MEHGALRTDGITLQETTHSFPLARQLIEPFRPHRVFSVVALKQTQRKTVRPVMSNLIKQELFNKNNHSIRTMKCKRKSMMPCTQEMHVCRKPHLSPLAHQVF